MQSALELVYIGPTFADNTYIFCSDPHILKENLHKVEDWVITINLSMKSLGVKIQTLILIFQRFV